MYPLQLEHFFLARKLDNYIVRYFVQCFFFFFRGGGGTTFFWSHSSSSLNTLFTINPHAYTHKHSELMFYKAPLKGNYPSVSTCFICSSSLSLDHWRKWEKISLAVWELLEKKSNQAIGFY